MCYGETAFAVHREVCAGATEGPGAAQVVHLLPLAAAREPKVEKGVRLEQLLALGAAACQGRVHNNNTVTARDRHDHCEPDA